MPNSQFAFECYIILRHLVYDNTIRIVYFIMIIFLIVMPVELVAAKCHDGLV